ncbi:hypothetical protein GCM10027436_04680 [Actinophytocola sediminis]
MTTNNRTIAPYITSWSAEQLPASRLVEHPGRGLAYTDEIIADRDDKGVLWRRSVSRPRQGRPEFGTVHPLRQRRAMRRLLCQVCGQPANRTEAGVLWLLKDHRTDWPAWPENMAVTEPPVCIPCVGVATRLCPALRAGTALIRVRQHPIIGVRAILHRQSPYGPIPIDEDLVRYDNPAIRWACATNLIRELHDCTIINPDDLCPNSTAP